MNENKEKSSGSVCVDLEDEAKRTTRRSNLMISNNFHMFRFTLQWEKFSLNILPFWYHWYASEQFFVCIT